MLDEEIKNIMLFSSENIMEILFRAGTRAWIKNPETD